MLFAQFICNNIRKSIIGAFHVRFIDMYNVFSILKSQHLKQSGQNLFSKYIPLYFKLNYYILEPTLLITFKILSKHDKNVFFITTFALEYLSKKL